MDDNRFDALTRALGAGRSRRGVLKGLGAAALGAFGLSRLGEAEAASHCRRPNTTCGKGSTIQCCSPGQICQSGACVTDCTRCGQGKTARCCGGGQTCQHGTCVTTCTPNCTGKCGGASDGCGGSCPGCCSASDCPGSDTECQVRTCANGVCGMAFTQAGAPLVAQTAGDCQTAVCDGSGGTTSVADNTDLPNDGNQCTDDVCAGGVPSNPAKAAGTACSQNGGTICDGAGTCTTPPCVPDCSSGIACANDGCGGACASSCSIIDCNTAFCDSGSCSYNSNSAAHGEPCNGGKGTCDNIGNCVANPGGPGTCPADSDYCLTGVQVSCNGSPSCFCHTTTSGALFCGTGGAVCADCNVDADCAGLGAGSACLDLGTNCSSCTGSNTPTHVCQAPCTA